MPELLVRRLLHGMGLRYRVQWRIPANRRRSVDVAFTRAKVAVFIDGCFWHGCPVHGRQPEANREWWLKKISGNKARDEDTARLLTEAGWLVLRFWAHEDAPGVAAQIASAVRTRTGSSKAH